MGLAICQALMLTGMVQYGVRRLTDAMQQMTNVERIIQYAELKPVSLLTDGVSNEKSLFIYPFE